MAQNKQFPTKWTRCDYDTPYPPSSRPRSFTMLKKWNKHVENRQKEEPKERRCTFFITCPAMAWPSLHIRHPECAQTQDKRLLLSEIKMGKYTKQISVVNAIFSRHYSLLLAEGSSWKPRHTHTHWTNNTPGAVRQTANIPKLLVES